MYRSLHVSFAPCRSDACYVLRKEEHPFHCLIIFINISRLGCLVHKEKEAHCNQMHVFSTMNVIFEQ
jgi:hypothetical protein